MGTDISTWKLSTTGRKGLHEIIIPERDDLTRSLYLYRLNLNKGDSTSIIKKDLELSFGVISGSVTVRIEDKKYDLKKFDSFYVPGGTAVELKAKEDCFLYIGGAVEEGFGEIYINMFDPDLEIGNVWQIHGTSPFQRDVYMTLGPHIPASRLITGFTWSEVGKWSSWPPHQHTADLEEAYCYFDMDAPSFGIHVSYLDSGKPTHAQIVHTGDIILAPEGYHPTVASPWNKNAYFWVLAAHKHSSRRYDLAVTDSAYSADVQE